MGNALQQLLKGRGLASLSAKEALILQMLTGKSEMFGLEMVEDSAGELKRGTVYVTLNRMEEKGFVESRLQPQGAGEIGPARRLYKITATGATVLQGHQNVASSLGLAWSGGRS